MAASLEGRSPIVRVLGPDGPIASARPGADRVGLASATFREWLERVATLIEDVWPQAAHDDAVLISESLARLAISCALVPTAPAEDAAAAVVRLVGPFVDQALGAPDPR